MLDLTAHMSQIGGCSMLHSHSPSQPAGLALAFLGVVTGFDLAALRVVLDLGVFMVFFPDEAALAGNVELAPALLARRFLAGPDAVLAAISSSACSSVTASG